MAFWVSFLPEQERTLRPDGIHLHGLRYWSPALAADVGRQSDKLLVKYDPRDLSRVFVRRPSGAVVEARYSDLTLPSITLAEAKAASRALHAKGRVCCRSGPRCWTAAAASASSPSSSRRSAPGFCRSRDGATVSKLDALDQGHDPARPTRAALHLGPAKHEIGAFLG